MYRNSYSENSAVLKYEYDDGRFILKRAGIPLSQILREIRMERMEKWKKNYEHRIKMAKKTLAEEQQRELVVVHNNSIREEIRKLIESAEQGAGNVLAAP